MPEHNDSQLLQKGLPCWKDNCGSSDAVAQYLDLETGRTRLYCFACGTPKWEDGQGNGAPMQATKARSNVDALEYAQLGAHKSIKSRGLTQATCKHWDYRVYERADGEFVQLAVYRDAQSAVQGVKVRPEDKDQIHWGAGSAKGNLFGRHLWPKGGRKLTITEGELDAMSVSQAWNHKFPVVSVPNGAKEAVKVIAANLEFVASFDEVVFAFDADEPGQAAAVECAKLLPAGKAKIVKWPQGFKDASDLLQAGQVDKLTWAIHSAEEYRPDGILDARTLTASCLDAPTIGLPWPWPAMTEWTAGRRGGEVYTFGAGSGVGKTEVLSEIIACTLMGQDRYGNTWTPEGVAVFGYEAGASKTKKAIAGKIGKRRFHLPNKDDGVQWTAEELLATMSLMDNELWARGGKLFVNDSKGRSDWESVKDRIRYLAHAHGIKHAFVDPISALVEEEEGVTDERKFLDRMVREAAKVAVELGISMYLFSHLTRPKEGPSHEEGGQVRSNQFRGSGGIFMFSDFVFGQERNSQADTPAERGTNTMRAVKDRLSGDHTGETFLLQYDPLFGLLDPVKYEPMAGMVGDL